MTFTHSTDRVRKHRLRLRQESLRRTRDSKRRKRTTFPVDTGSIRTDEETRPETDCSSNQKDIRNAALRTIFQFRAPPRSSETFSVAVQTEIKLLQKQISEDLSNHIDTLDPLCYHVCCSCGREVHKKESIVPSLSLTVKWKKMLANKFYEVPKDQEDFVICSTCRNTLRSSKIPCQALMKGWAFSDCIPPALNCLSKHERVLIALRLPCVYVWRAQGGFGQFAYKGCPVSFANPIAELVKALPRHPTTIFSALLENGQKVVIDVNRIRRALDWLLRFNPLYANISVDDHAFQEIASFQTRLGSIAMLPTQQNPPEAELSLPSSTELHEATNSERLLGFQGPLDEESLYHLSTQQTMGVDDADNLQYSQMLIQHILKPFSHRKRNLIPSYDASENLESYFPVLFPYGRGGPSSTGTSLGFWTKHALSVKNSRFMTDIDFIFFIYAVLHRKRLTGLSAHAPLRDTCTKAIVNIRELLSAEIPDHIVKTRIDKLLRTGSLNASFEKLRGSPAFWASLKKSAWAYLAALGPCQLFLTISAADLIDPFLFMQANRSLTFEEASCLSSRQRAQILANNPVSATQIFHRRISSFFDNFLFGNTMPFGYVRGYLGRIEQQARHSPHLHLLLWLDDKGPTLSGDEHIDGELVANFIERFCTALLPKDELTQHELVPIAVQKHPIPVYKTVYQRRRPAETVPLSGPQRHSALASPYRADAFNGSKENNVRLREQMIATQFHVCQNYCMRADHSCRFLFPFPAQSRGSLAIRSNSRNNTRKVALAPRYSPFINSTHPMLTAMCRANTDVTIIVGNSIAESMYVCNYAVKADKNPLFDPKSLRKLKKLTDGTVEDRKLLASIARNSAGVRTVGAQEAVDFLLNNPLTFSSAKVTNVNTAFLLYSDGALTEDQAMELDQKHTGTFCEILSDMDNDEDVAITSPLKRKRGDTIPYTDSDNTLIMDPFLRQYVRRPDSLDSLSPTKFHQCYDTKKCPERRSVIDSEMLLRPVNIYSTPRQLHQTSKILVYRRQRKTGQPWPSHILNVLNRGPVDETSPRFAAAALTLHVPFRTTSDLLHGMTVTERLSALLQNPNRFPELSTYIERCHDLSKQSTAPFTAQYDSTKRFNTGKDDLESEGSYESSVSSESESEEIQVNPLLGLPPITASCGGPQRPLEVSNEWRNNTSFPNGAVLQMDLFRVYVSDCRKFGLRYADEKQRSLREPNDDGKIFETARFIEPNEIFLEKERIRNLCKNSDQMIWIDSVMSYLQVFYSQNVEHVPQHLITLCKENHPIFTNAAGGCGKSWLIKQVSAFVNNCIPVQSLPIHAANPHSSSPAQLNPEGFYISPSDFPAGRLGRVACFAPSGVAAGNCDGFTFHNGLRSNKITLKQLREGLSSQILSRLIADFAQVVCVVVDEFSMSSLILIAYLDKVLRMVRPACCCVPFGGLPVIFTGDAYQLPVVSGHGLLSNPSSISEELETIYEHCTKGAFYLELGQSVRQGNDDCFRKLLNRIRLCEAIQKDADTLNSRWIKDYDALLRESSGWATAPILTSKNSTVDALNDALVHRNGSILGTFHLHSMPTIPKAKSKQSRQKHAHRFFNQRKTCRTASHFSPPSSLVLYPGIPLMLRINTCPAIGLSNGSIGSLISILQDNETLEPHEPIEQAIERAIDKSSKRPHVPSLLIRFSHCYRGRVTALCSEGDNKMEKVVSDTVVVDPYSFPGLRGPPVSVVHAMSMHKSQSLTLPFSIIDPRETFCMGALLLALSRSPSLEHIALLTPVTLEILNKYKKQCATVSKRIGSIQKASSSLKPFMDFIKAQETWIYDHDVLQERPS